MDRVLFEEHAQMERDHWWFVARREIVRRVLLRHLGAGTSRRILDVGCGTGGMLPLLAEFGHVQGLEADPLAVEHCKAAYSAFEVRQGEIPTDVPADGSFDVVTAFDVIEHIEDDHAAMSALGTALRPGGTVVLTVPALMWLWSDHDAVNGHHRRYVAAQLDALIRGTGFDLDHRSYFNTILLPVVATARLVQRVRRPAVEPGSDFSMPSPIANRVLTRLMAAEQRGVAGRGLPVGVSLVAVATRIR